ncbi:MAG TPA: haloacid dehalogenase, partial [Firmicutes bacterium]|nr:haloacid dehalogenase [Bacillota bacterium]
LKKKNIKIGLATSGLDYKAIPEIVSAFKTLNMGDPLTFYDCIVTGGK